MIIDFHVHTFPDAIAEKTIQLLSQRSGTLSHTDGTLTGLKNSMQDAGITVSVNLPVVTNPASTQKINDTAIHITEGFDGTGVLAFGGIHPDTENFRDELHRLHRSGIRGIKIHPDYQGVFFDDIRYLRILDCAAELGMIIVTHAGVDIGLPKPVHCAPKQVLHVLEQVQPEKLVLAHMGGWRMAAEAEQSLCGAPVYFDTAYSLGSACSPDGKVFRLMDEDAFVRIIRKHGADRVLFATDSPWAGQKNCLEELNKLPLSDAEKEQILGRNAEKLLKINR